jgi:Domain of unknown function (DUF6538)
MVHHDGPREPEIPLPSYLRRRGHTWFLQWKWPSHLAAFGFSGELVRSLRTSEFRIARRRAPPLVLQIETMTESTQLPKRAELESAIRRWIDDSVWRQEIKRAETDGPDFLQSHEIEKMGREDATTFPNGNFAPEAVARRHFLGFRVSAGRWDRTAMHPTVSAKAAPPAPAGSPRVCGLH